MNKYISIIILLAFFLLVLLGIWRLLSFAQPLLGGRKSAIMISIPTSSSQCDDTLWRHVYHGRFKTAQDRLKIINSCILVTGMIVNAKKEADGDWHIRLDVDDKTLLNDKNKSGQNGYLVLEPMCANAISQRDVLEEGICDGFSQHIFTKDMIGQKVKVKGALVEDQEHGSWREIHPVTEIKIIQ